MEDGGRVFHTGKKRVSTLIFLNLQKALISHGLSKLPINLPEFDSFEIETLTNLDKI